MIHFFFPGTGQEPSVITDFKGVVGLANVNAPAPRRTARVTNRSWPSGSDNRFMKGEYIGVDGERHSGTFAFI